MTHSHTTRGFESLKAAVLWWAPCEFGVRWYKSRWNTSIDVNKVKYFMTVWDWWVSRRLGGTSEK